MRIEPLEERQMFVADVYVNVMSDLYEGGSPGEFQFTRSETTGALTVDYAFDTASTATPPANGSVVFADGVDTVSLYFSGESDNLFEGDESLILNIEPDASYAIGNASAWMTIYDDEMLPTVNLVDPSFTPAEDAGEVSFQVTLDTASSYVTTVNYQLLPGSADSSDFSDAASPVTGVLTFQPGETTKDIRVAINDDLIDEDEEGFTIELVGASGATINNSQLAVSITDNDDAPLVSIADAPSATEGEVAEFVVTLSQASSKTITVYYQQNDGTAIGYEGDYYDSSGYGMLVFDPGQTSKTIQIQADDDSLPEYTETFSIELTSAENATIDTSQGRNLGDGQIVDNDADRQITLSATGSVNENDDVFTVDVQLSGPSARTASVHYRTNDGSGSDKAVAGDDFIGVSDGLLQFDSQTDTQTIYININTDGLYENSETFTITLFNEDGVTVLNNTMTVTLVNNDPAPTANLVDSYVTVSEGLTQKVFTVTLDTPSAQPTTVYYTVNPGDTESGDFTDQSQSPGTITFAPYQQSAEIVLDFAADGVDEEDETFTIELTGSPDAYIGNSQLLVTITDDDNAPEVSIADATPVNEGGNALFVVTLSQASEKVVTVNYTTQSGSALEGSDYVYATGTLVFNPGDPLTQTIEVQTQTDGIDEPDQQFFVTLETTGDGTVTIDDGQGQGTIVDIDSSPTVSISGPTSVSETDGYLEFYVTLSQPSEYDIEVTYVTQIGTADGDDFTMATGVLTFLADEWSPQLQQMVQIGITDDMIFEEDETFVIALTNADHATIQNGQLTVTILDNETPADIYVAEEEYTYAEVVDEGSYDFGSTFVGEPVVRTFTIYNHGDDDLVLGNLELPEQFELVGDPPTPISSWGSAQIVVRFLATEAGVYDSPLVFTTNDPDIPSFNFDLNAEAITPFADLTLLDSDDSEIASEGSYDFGPMIVGQTPIEHFFTIRNDGNIDLNLSSMRLPEGFTLGLGYDTIVPPGEFTTFTLLFTPTWTGAYDDQFQLVSNDDDGVPFKLQLTGSAVALQDLRLVRDTGAYDDDGITTQPAVWSTVLGDFAGGSARVEIDHNGDGVAESVIDIDAEEPWFQYDPADTDPSFAGFIGGVSLNYRLVMLDGSGNPTVSEEGWRNFGFEMEELPPASGLQNFGLLVDDGIYDYDGVSTQDTLTGVFGSADATSFAVVEFDFDSDGSADDTIVVRSGEAFEYNPAGWGLGEHSVQARLREWSSNYSAELVGAWEGFSFTKNLLPPEIGDFAPRDVDPENPNGGIASTVVAGSLAEGTSKPGGVEVEFDFDNDGVTDATTWTDEDGRFEYNPGVLPGGGVVVQVRTRVEEQGLSFESEWVMANVNYNPIIATEFDGLVLVNDTQEGDVIGTTTDPEIAGNLLGEGNDWVKIEIDLDEDGIADDFSTSDEEGHFSYTPILTAAGSVTLRARSTVWDDVSGAWLYGQWAEISYDYELPPADLVVVSDLELVFNTSTEEGVFTTTDPLLAGTLTDDGSTAYLTVEIDYDGDALADATTKADAQGNFRHRMQGVAAGSTTVSARAREWDYRTRQYVFGEWTDLTFTLEDASLTPPGVQNLHLVSDSGSSATDLVTANALLAGDVVNERNVGGLYLEIDYNGDGDVDNYAFPEFDGSFFHDPIALPYGSVTVSVRTAWWDVGTSAYARSSWSDLSFTYEQQTNVAAQLVELNLADDDDEDLVGTNPTVSGRITNEGELAGVTIELDLDDDGVLDRVTTTNSRGEFEHRLHGLAPGTITVAARVREFDDVNKQFLYGSWQSLTFTYTAPVDALAAIDSLSFDLGEAGFVEASDAQVTGVVSNDGDPAGLTVEFDHDGDNIVDGRAYTDAEGGFTYSPQGLAAGTHTLRARVQESLDNGGTQTSGWSSIEITLVENGTAAPAQTNPSIANFRLDSDTGASATDGATSNATVMGSVVGLDNLSGVSILLTGSGVYETLETDAYGNFSYTPTDLDEGRVTLQARVLRAADADGLPVSVAPASLSFVYSSDPDGAAAQAIVDIFAQYELDSDSAKVSLEDAYQLANNTYNAARDAIYATYDGVVATANDTHKAALDSASAAFDQAKASADAVFTSAMSSVMGAFTTNLANFTGDASSHQLTSVEFPRSPSDNSTPNLPEDSQPDPPLEKPDYVGEAYDLSKDPHYQKLIAAASAAYEKEIAAANKAYQDALTAAKEKLATDNRATLNTYQTDRDNWLSETAALETSFASDVNPYQAKAALDQDLKKARDDYNTAVVEIKSNFETLAGNLPNYHVQPIVAAELVFFEEVAVAEGSWLLYLAGFPDTASTAYAERESDYYAALAAAHEHRASAYIEKLFGTADAAQIAFGDWDAGADFGTKGAISYLEAVRDSKLAKALHARQKAEAEATLKFEETMAQRKRDLNTLRIDNQFYTRTGDDGTGTPRTGPTALGLAGLEEKYANDLAENQLAYRNTLAAKAEIHSLAYATQERAYDLKMAEAKVSALAAKDTAENTLWSAYQLELANSQLERQQNLAAPQQQHAVDDAAVDLAEAEDVATRLRAASQKKAEAARLQAIAEAAALKVYDTDANDALFHREGANARNWESQQADRSEADMDFAVSQAEAAGRRDLKTVVANRDQAKGNLVVQVKEIEQEALSIYGFARPYLVPNTAWGYSAAFTSYNAVNYFSHAELYANPYRVENPLVEYDSFDVTAISVDYYAAVINANYAFDSEVIDARDVYAEAKNNVAAEYQTDYLDAELDWKHEIASAHGAYESDSAKAAADYAYAVAAEQRAVAKSLAALEKTWWEQISAADATLYQASATEARLLAIAQAEAQQTFQTGVAADYYQQIYDWDQSLDTLWSSYVLAVADAERTRIGTITGANVVYAGSAGTANITWTSSTSSAEGTYSVGLAQAEFDYLKDMEEHWVTEADDLLAAQKTYAETIATKITLHDLAVLAENHTWQTALIANGLTRQNGIDQAEWDYQLARLSSDHEYNLAWNDLSGQFANREMVLPNCDRDEALFLAKKAEARTLADYGTLSPTDPNHHLGLLARLDATAAAEIKLANDNASDRQDWVDEVGDLGVVLAGQRATAQNTLAAAIQTAVNKRAGEQKTLAKARAATYATLEEAYTVAYAKADGKSAIDLGAAAGVFDVAAGGAAALYSSQAGTAYNAYYSTLAEEHVDAVAAASQAEAGNLVAAFHAATAQAEELRQQTLQPFRGQYEQDLASASASQLQAVVNAQNLYLNELYNAQDGVQIVYQSGLAAADRGWDVGYANAAIDRSHELTVAANARSVTQVQKQGAYNVALVQASHEETKLRVAAEVVWIGSMATAKANQYRGENLYYTDKTEQQVADDFAAASAAADTLRSDKFAEAELAGAEDVGIAQGDRASGLGDALTAEAAAVGSSWVTYAGKLATADSTYASAVTTAVLTQTGNQFDADEALDNLLAAADRAYTASAGQYGAALTSNSAAANIQNAGAAGYAELDFYASVVGRNALRAAANGGDAFAIALLEAQVGYFASLAVDYQQFQELLTAAESAYQATARGIWTGSDLAQMDHDASQADSLSSPARQQAIDAAAEVRQSVEDQVDRASVRRNSIAQANQQQLTDYAAAEKARAIAVAAAEQRYQEFLAGAEDAPANLEEDRVEKLATAERDAAIAKADADRDWRHSLANADHLYLNDEASDDQDFSTGIAAVDNVFDLAWSAVAAASAPALNLLDAGRRASLQAAEAIRVQAIASAEAEWESDKFAHSQAMFGNVSTAVGTPFAAYLAEIASARFAWWQTYRAAYVQAAVDAHAIDVVYENNVAGADADEYAAVALRAINRLVADSSGWLASLAAISQIPVDYSTDVSGAVKTYVKAVADADYDYAEDLADIEYDDKTEENFDRTGAEEAAHTLHKSKLKTALNAYALAVGVPVADLLQDSADAEHDDDSDSAADDETQTKADSQNAHTRDLAVAAYRKARDAAQADRTEAYDQAQKASFAAFLLAELDDTDSPWHAFAIAEAAAVTAAAASFNPAARTARQQAIDADKTRGDTLAGAGKTLRDDLAAARKTRQQSHADARQDHTTDQITAQAPLPGTGELLTTPPLVPSAPGISLIPISSGNPDDYITVQGSTTDLYLDALVDDMFTAPTEPHRPATYHQTRLDHGSYIPNSLRADLIRQTPPANAIDLHDVDSQAVQAGGSYASTVLSALQKIAAEYTLPFLSSTIFPLNMLTKIGGVNLFSASIASFFGWGASPPESLDPDGEYAEEIAEAFAIGEFEDSLLKSSDVDYETTNIDHRKVTSYRFFLNKDVVTERGILPKGTTLGVVHVPWSHSNVFINEVIAQMERTPGVFRSIQFVPGNGVNAVLEIPSLNDDVRIKTFRTLLGDDYVRDNFGPQFIFPNLNALAKSPSKKEEWEALTSLIENGLSQWTQMLAEEAPHVFWAFVENYGEEGLLKLETVLREGWDIVPTDPRQTHTIVREFRGFWRGSRGPSRRRGDAWRCCTCHLAA
ncbi:Calx-beta domain-containing protein [Lignipirellula cremea]|uniref:Calx-beta domain protein n=1 Tax=Lignipirellula cremea TaxID=2528010 RepID=A0A518DVD2_9BACT|nr:Calx-beta domain-containing protein [Lignipirellula cremea]QDU95795.1 Calx-beta domain protein [Lignipirellula cremea]